jgi:hypothetical protein
MCVYVGVGARAWACAFTRVALSSMQRACAILSFAACGCTTFFDIISYTARFSEKKLLDIKCVFRFSLQLLFEAFLILKRIQRDIVINVKYPVFLLD